MFNFFKKNKQQNTAHTEQKKSISTDYTDTSAIADFFKHETGVNFDNQQSILKSKLSSFCIIRQIPSFQQCLAEVKSNFSLKQELINYLTTNESFFYREFGQIESFVAEAKKKLSSDKQKIDILCAPCATGEEVYSIVIALFEAGVRAEQFDVVGIDINTQALGLAKEGIYKARSVSKIPPETVVKYFSEQDNNYVLSSRVKQKVQFYCENIFNPSFSRLGKFDYIFSRNMLIYFDLQTKDKAKAVFNALLKDQTNAVYYGHADLY